MTASYRGLQTKKIETNYKDETSPDHYDQLNAKVNMFEFVIFKCIQHSIMVCYIIMMGINLTQLLFQVHTNVYTHILIHMYYENNREGLHHFIQMIKTSMSRTKLLKW